MNKSISNTKMFQKRRKSGQKIIEFRKTSESKFRQHQDGDTQSQMSSTKYGLIQR